MLDLFYAIWAEELLKSLDIEFQHSCQRLVEILQRQGAPEAAVSNALKNKKLQINNVSTIGVRSLVNPVEIPDQREIFLRIANSVNMNAVESGHNFSAANLPKDEDVHSHSNPVSRWP